MLMVAVGVDLFKARRTVAMAAQVVVVSAPWAQSEVQAFLEKVLMAATVPTAALVVVVVLVVLAVAEQLAMVLPVVPDWQTPSPAHLLPTQVAAVVVATIAAVVVVLAVAVMVPL